MSALDHLDPYFSDLLRNGYPSDQTLLGLIFSPAQFTVTDHTEDDLSALAFFILSQTAGTWAEWRQELNSLLPPVKGLAF